MRADGSQRPSPEDRPPLTETSTARLRRAFLSACALDVAVRKPGNVSADSPGHGMQAAQFLASAEAAAGPLFAPDRSVGERIEGAVAATLAVAGCNTNLGILLLCAPLAQLAELEPRCGMARGAGDGEHPRDPAAWRVGLVRVLDALDRDDAAAAFRAITAAHPGGLGRSDAQDVHHPPTVTLKQAMTIAAPRDRIAQQYASGFADLFELGLPTLAAHRGAGGTLTPAAVQALFLAYLGRWPDSHIVRKHGADMGQLVTSEAGIWHSRSANGEAVGTDPAFAAWDESLKARGLNPGTSADLTVATLCLALSLGCVGLDTTG
jgi:triphosphoribosyl-dephospho-CoA synthase